MDLDTAEIIRGHDGCHPEHLNLEGIHCFQIDKDTWCFPSLLDETEPYWLRSNPNMHMERLEIPICIFKEYYFRKIMIHFGQKLKKEAIYWFGGLYFHNNETNCKIIITLDRLNCEIAIEISHTYNDNDVIAAQIEQIKQEIETALKKRT